MRGLLRIALLVNLRIVRVYTRSLHKARGRAKEFLAREFPRIPRGRLHRCLTTVLAILPLFLT